MAEIVVFVMDTSRGTPAAGLPVTLQQRTNGRRWKTVCTGHTDETGCIPEFVPEDVELSTGDYRLVYETAGYFRKRNIASFYPQITAQFFLADDTRHVLPLLLGPYSYTFYRGS